jgi:hypothetical protein
MSDNNPSGETSADDPDLRRSCQGVPFDQCTHVRRAKASAATIVNALSYGGLKMPATRPVQRERKVLLANQEMR